MNRFKNLTLWQIDAAGICICAVLALVWYAAGLQPLAQAKAQRVAMIDEAASHEDAATKAEAEQHAAATDLDAVLKQQAQQSVKLCTVDHQTARQAELVKLATTHHLTSDEVKPGATTVGTRFTTIALSMTGTGTAVDLAEFLHDVRTLLPDFGVASFDVRGEPENTERPARFTLNFVWYAAPSGAAAAK